MWSATGLGTGTHTLRIEWTGRHDTLATASTVDIDAFDISGMPATPGTLVQTPTITRFEQDSPLLAWAGTWTDSTSDAYSGHTLKMLGGAGHVDVAFSGSKCELIARTGNKFGIARVSVDGGAWSDIDLYSATTVYQSSVWHTTGLSEGPHTLSIEWTGRQNAASTANTIDVDAFDVSGAPTLSRVEQEDASFVWAGTWPMSSSGSFSGGTYRSATASASVTFSFSGTAAALIARTGSKFGIASVSVDGGAPVDVDLYTATTAYQAVAWRSATLAPGPHTLKIAWTGRMNAASTSNMVDVDAIDVTGTTGVLTQAL